MNETNPAQLAPYVTGGAFAFDFAFGAIGNKANFCTMGAVSDWVNIGDMGRMRMWLLAIPVAVLGSSALQLAGFVDLSKSIYPSPNFTWLSYLVGAKFKASRSSRGFPLGGNAATRRGPARPSTRPTAPRRS